MGVSVFEGRVSMNVSRSDEVALLGMAENMFGIVVDNYPQLVTALRSISERALDKEDPEFEKKHTFRLRVITFIKVHKIK